ncbi:MAG: class I mannose-6-phosphate isomerase [bacterium]|nr:class I mannose-6-phosphate isomerase [bacterium]
MRIYPLLLKPRLFPRVWGGRRLQEIIAPDLDFAPALGEVWTVHGDLEIVNGSYMGQTLGELWQRHSLELFGNVNSLDHFPLLVKWLDTSEWLSLQVHPDDEQARLIEGRPDVNGKVECWFVVNVSGDGELICGCRTEIDAQEIAHLSGRELLQHLHRQKVRQGDFLFLPAGTIHALGPGITVLEVQQSSDITYRFYDWDRPHYEGIDRPLHLQQARQAWINSKRIAVHGGWTPRHSLGVMLTANNYFTQEIVEGDGPWRWNIECLEIIAVIQGQGKIALDNSAASLVSGRVAVIPAAGQTVEVTPFLGRMQFMRIMCPAVLYH